MFKNVDGSTSAKDLRLSWRGWGFEIIGPLRTLS